MSKILVVDDEENIRELICKYASAENISTDQADNGLKAIEMVNNNDYDVIIMDIMMPYLDGFSAVKEIRKKSFVPVIMLSARDEEYDKLYGFDLGIDDYVTKPFSPKELMRRIHAIINRVDKLTTIRKNKENIFVYETLKVNYDAHQVTIDDVTIDLTPKEYELLVQLLKNVNIAQTREQLISCVWSNDFVGDERTLDTHVKSLRKKLGRYALNIVTIRRVGYRFENKTN